MSIKGRYELVSSDKYDEYLKAVGVGMIQRNVASKAKPIMQWTQTNGKWAQKTEAGFKNFQIEFVLGEEFDEVLMDGRKSKSMVTLVENTLTHKQSTGGMTSVITREFNGDEMITKFYASDVVATRVFRKL